MRPIRPGPRKPAAPGKEQWVVGIFLGIAIAAFIYLRSTSTIGRVPKPEAETAVEPSALYEKGTDPRMDKAIAEARRRWPEFVAAFQEQRPGDQLFSIQVLRRERGRAELRWMSVTQIEGGLIHCIPEVLTAQRASAPLGPPLIVALSDMRDWMYARDGEVFGGFTMRALSAIQDL